MYDNNILVIAGSDSSGGAGINADIKAAEKIGVHAFIAITAVTAQSSSSDTVIYPISTEVIAKQIDYALNNPTENSGINNAIYIKIGMLYNVEIINLIVNKIIEYKNLASNKALLNIVLDPIIKASNNSKLLQDDAISELKNRLFPLTNLITPNIPEAELLTNVKIKNTTDMQKAADILIDKYGANSVLIKGGHADNANLTDLLVTKNKIIKLEHKRININNIRGTGCTYSTAITAYMAQSNLLQSDSLRKNSLIEAVEKAHRYTQEYIKEVSNSTSK